MTLLCFATLLLPPAFPIQLTHSTPNSSSQVPSTRNVDISGPCEWGVVLCPTQSQIWEKGRHLGTWVLRSGGRFLTVSSAFVEKPRYIPTVTPPPAPCPPSSCADAQRQKTVQRALQPHAGRLSPHTRCLALYSRENWRGCPRFCAPVPDSVSPHPLFLLVSLLSCWGFFATGLIPSHAWVCRNSLDRPGVAQLQLHPFVHMEGMPG